MSDSNQRRTFISYSRQDGARAARCLRWWLVKHRLSVWQDIDALEGGRDWWSQIEEALKSKALQHFVLIVTPAALASPHVRREIRLARQEGKTVCPIKGPGLTDLNKLPPWLGEVYDLEVPERRTNLLRVLEGDSRPSRVPMMAPGPPEDFVPCPTEFDALKQQLLNAKGDAVAGITAALRGAGGYGKTTLAKALAHDPDIQDAFFDGILWADLGEKPDRLLATLSDLIKFLTGERPGLETINAAAAKLGEALGDRRILLIVDDAWREQDLRPFLHGGSNCVRLVTTRIDGVLPRNAVLEKVDAMKAGEALELLSAGLPQEQVSCERATLAKLAARLGKWALLLKLVNALLRPCVIEENELLSQAIAGAHKRLEAKGLVIFDAQEESERAKAVARTIGVSLELLSETQRARFGELAVFPEDAEIPIGVAARLWETTGGLADFETEDLLRRLDKFSLLFALGRGVFRLHDTIRHYILDLAKDGLIVLHKRLVAALDGAATEETDSRTRRYYYLYLPHHLAEAGERGRLDAVLLDPSWLREKLEVTANPQALVADYDHYGAGEAQSLIGRTLRLISGILARDAGQLPVQLAARLAGFEAVEATGLVDNARLLFPRPALVPLWPTLTAPGAEIERFEADSGVIALCPLLPDGRLASSSYGRLQLWDVASGAARTVDSQSAREGNAFCVTADGRLAYASWDKTVRVWDVAKGAETARLSDVDVIALCCLRDGRLALGFEDGTISLWNGAADEPVPIAKCDERVTALCLLPDGRLASSSYKAISLWDLGTGAETRLGGDGDTKGAASLCALPDGRLVAGRWDGAIRIWDTVTSAGTTPLEGHADPVTTLCLLPDGRLASASDDRTIRLWDITIGAEKARFEGHSDRVNALCPLSDGRLASGSNDGTIRLWDITTSLERAGEEGIKVSVAALCVLPDGRFAVVGSEDAVIQLCDAATGAEIARIDGTGFGVTAICLLPEGRLVTGSSDGVIEQWDCVAGAASTLVEFAGGVDTLSVLPDGRLASGSWNDGTIRLWDAATGVETGRLEGEFKGVNSLCVLPDGRLASGSDDGVRLWEVEERREPIRFGHDIAIALCPLRDGRLASGEFEGTIRLWDVTTGVESTCLKGHTDEVISMCVFTDSRLASGSKDKTIRLWDLAKGKELARLELDAR
jgi:WD40 repeat protein